MRLVVTIPVAEMDPFGVVGMRFQIDLDWLVEQLHWGSCAEFARLRLPLLIPGIDRCAELLWRNVRVGVRVGVIYGKRDLQG